MCIMHKEKSIVSTLTQNALHTGGIVAGNNKTLNPCPRCGLKNIRWYESDYEEN